MEERAKVNTLISNLKEYAEERIKLAILNLHDKSSKLLSTVATTLIFICTCIFALLFVSIAIAYWIGYQTQEPFMGFIIVGGFYVLLTIILGVYRDKLFRNRISNAFIKNMYDDEN